jgi:hypothetical protein
MMSSSLWQLIGGGGIIVSAAAALFYKTSSEDEKQKHPPTPAAKEEKRKFEEPNYGYSSSYFVTTPPAEAAAAAAAVDGKTTTTVTEIGYKYFHKRSDGTLYANDVPIAMFGLMVEYKEGWVTTHTLPEISFFRDPKDILRLKTADDVVHRVEVYGEVRDNKCGYHPFVFNARSIKVLEPFVITREMTLAAINDDAWLVKRLSEEHRADKEIGIAAVRKEGCSVQYLSAELRADRDIALAAVKRNGVAIVYIDEKFLSDKEITLAAAENWSGTAEYLRTVEARTLW